VREARKWPRVPFRAVVGVVDRSAAERLRAGESLPKKLGGIEIRADLLAGPAEALELLELTRRRVPVLFTCRHRNQGGEYEGDEERRVALYHEAISRGAAMVDVEWGSPAGSALLAAGAPVVLSWHDFDGMPGSAELERLTREMASSGAPAIKIVPTASCAADGVRMLDWLTAGDSDGPARIGFAMTERAVFSRLLSVARGAPFTYGALGDVVAPGQLLAEDLLSIYRVDVLGPSTRVLGVAGNPVSHSLSPNMHNPALAAANIDRVYLPFLLDALRELDGLWDAIGLVGLSVTVPFKEEAFEIADDLHPRVRAARAANTLVVDESAASRIDPDRGRPFLKAYNTDFDGVLGPLRRRLEHLQGVQAAIIGNGGAARGAVEALKSVGAAPTLVYRNVKKGPPVAAELGVPALAIRELNPTDFRVVINATPLGLRADDPSPVPETLFSPEKIAFDMVYAPAPTAFVRAARARGAQVIEGGEMLIAQGLVQFELFHGRSAKESVFVEGFRSGLARRAARETKES
jgi:3-dehydroquinate dehydratase/shikimate dehydrogenase